MEKAHPVVALPGYDPEHGYFLGVFTAEGRRLAQYVRPTDDGQPPDLAAILPSVKQIQEQAVRDRRPADVLANGQRMIEVIESYLAGRGYPG